MRFWEDKDGNGKALTDGRVCLVIRPDDPSMPEIRTYGRDKDEVLEKVAKTAETAQAEIHRLRGAKSAPSSGAAASPAPRVTADEQARATADLSDPSKSPEAIKTLLRASGVPIDNLKLKEDAERVALVARNWEAKMAATNPEVSAIMNDERNQRALMNTASLRVGFQNITEAALDAAYHELAQHGMLFEVAPGTPEKEVETVPPGGSRDSRTVRTATSYRANSLRTPTPVVSTKPKYTRAQVEAMNSRDFRVKIETEPGFKEWYDKEFAAKSA